MKLWRNLFVLLAVFLLLISFSSPSVAQSVTKRCGINIDPLNPAGFPGGEQLKGVGWARVVFKVGGGYSAYDPVVNALNAAGVNVLMILNHETYWGDGVNNWNQGSFDAYAQNFGIKAGEIATHYGSKVAAYEIWNEPDGVGEQFAHLDPGQLGKVVAAATPPVHRAGAKVVVGGFVGGENVIGDYVRQMGSAVSGADAISGHPYAKQPNTDEFHNYLNTVTGLGKPFWITEFSTGNTDNGQASSDYMKAFYEDVEKNYGAKVPVAIWFAWSDNMEAPGTSFGITNRSGAPKEPVYTTFFKDACSATVPSDLKTASRSLYVYPGIEDETGSPEQLKRASEYMLTCGARFTFAGQIENADKINNTSIPGFSPIPLDCSSAGSCTIPQVAGFAYVNHEQTTIPLFRFQDAIVPTITSSSRRLDDLEGFFSSNYQGPDTIETFVGNGVSNNISSPQLRCENTIRFLESIRNLCDHEVVPKLPINNETLLSPPAETTGADATRCALDLTVPGMSTSYLDVLAQRPAGFSCGETSDATFLDYRKNLELIETTTPKAFKPAYIVHYVDSPAIDPTIFDKVENWLRPEGESRGERLNNRVKVTKVYVPAGFATTNSDTPALPDKSISTSYNSGFMNSMLSLTPKEVSDDILKKITNQAAEIFSKSSASNMTDPDPFSDKFLSCPECDEENFISILVKRINAETFVSQDPDAENLDCMATDVAGEKAEQRKQTINPDGTRDPVTEISMTARATLKAGGSIGKKVSMRTYFLLPSEYKQVYEYEKILAGTFLPPETLTFSLSSQDATAGGIPNYKFLQLSDTAPKFGRSGKTVHMSVVEKKGQTIGFNTVTRPSTTGPGSQTEPTGPVNLIGSIVSTDTNTFDINPLVPGGRLARTLWELVCHTTQPPAEKTYAPYAGFEKILQQGKGACFQDASSRPGPEAICRVGDTVTPKQNSSGRNVTLSDGIIALAIQASKYTCTPAELLVGVLAQETGGKNYQPDKEPTEVTISGDPNERICRTARCVRGEADQSGLFSFYPTNFRNVYNKYKTNADTCMQKLAIGLPTGDKKLNEVPTTSDGLDPRIAGHAICVTGDYFWVYLTLNNDKSCNQQAAKLEDFDQATIDHLLYSFCAPGSDIEGTEAYAQYNGYCTDALKIYKSLIEAYKGDVQRVRETMNSCPGN